MPKYMINMTIGLSIDLKEDFVKKISLKLKENNYPFEMKNKEHKNSGLVYWTFETDKPVPDELLRKIEQEVISEVENKYAKVSINPQ